MKEVLNYLHLVVATFLAMLSHLLVAIILPDLLPSLIYPVSDIYFPLSPLLSVVVSYWVSFLYLKTSKVDNYKMKAVITTITGTVLVWASCVGLVCALMPALTNM